MVANPIRFEPLDGIDDADERGAGTFHFDDGTSMVAEDPELAGLVKSYQDVLAPPQPDQRLAQNDATDDPIGAVFGADPFGDNAGPEQAADFLAGAGEYKYLTPEEAAAKKAASQPEVPTPKARGYIPETNGGISPPQTASGGPVTPAIPSALPPAPGDAQNAAELHRLAAERDLRGGYVQGREAGYVPGSRTGALDPTIAGRQADERNAANQDLLSATEQGRAQEASVLRQSALREAMRISVQKAEQQRIQREAEQKKQRLNDERRAVNDAKIDTSFAQGDSFRQVAAVLGAALLGAVGSDAGLRMIESNIDRHVRKELQTRGSKLQTLAEQIGDENQVISAAKARIMDLLEKQAGVTQKNLDASGIENQTPAVIAQLRKRMNDEEQEFERQSLGKTTEVYQQGVRGGRTGPDLEGAAKHYEQAAKLAPVDTSGIEDLPTDSRKDFVARMEGLADAEHSLNEIDSNIGIQRDAAGNVANKKQLEAGNIEGAGFFGGRVPDEYTSTKGSALSREQRRLIQAQVKAMSGAAATDVERAEYGKNLPLVDEKDLLNATTEERRRWQRNYAKAVSLYGQSRVDSFLGRYRGQRAQINAGRGRSGGVQSAEGQVLELDE